MTARFVTTIVAGAALLASGCSAMTGFDTTARTAPPGNDRFARGWCEAESKEGRLIACGSAKVPTVPFGASCVCLDPKDPEQIVTGRVVSRPNPAKMTAASRAYSEAD